MRKIKLSDYVFEYLYSQGIRHAFMLSGGGIMHLVDSLGNSEMDYVCCHHEQAASIAAQAYSMYHDSLGLCLATTGPGGTNALTGCAAAFVDSTPVIYMTGQVKRADFASLRGVRQFGAQENDIISMAKPVTKYAVLIDEPESIAYELEKAVNYATSGRKGPVWIDIPLDIQSAEIDADALKHFSPESENLSDVNDESIKKAYEVLLNSKRPVILIGQGAYASGAYEVLRELVEKTHIPVLATWRVLDFMGTDEDGFYGSPGLQAPRYSNLILQYADCLVSLGTRLDNMITAFNEKHFGYRAKRIIVDIDNAEMEKLDMPDKLMVESDVKSFCEKLIKIFSDDDTSILRVNCDKWRERCDFIKKRYPILEEKQDKADKVDLYKVTMEISKYASEDDAIVISSTSRCNTAGHIAFEHKRGQRTISSMGMGSMGFAIPSAVGAYYASGNKRTIVIEGDGSLQLNIQELQTIAAYGIDAKMFIFDNNGYAAITTMQDRNFDSHYVGSNDKSGVSMPDMEKIAKAYNITFFRISEDYEIEDTVRKTMETSGPVICDIRGSLWFDEIPKCISYVDEVSGERRSALLENPYPFLSDDEMKEIEEILIRE